MERKPIRSQTPLHLMVKETVVSKVSRYQDPRKDGRGEGRGGEGRGLGACPPLIYHGLCDLPLLTPFISLNRIFLISSHLISSHLISSHLIPLKSHSNPSPPARISTTRKAMPSTSTFPAMTEYQRHLAAHFQAGGTLEEAARRRRVWDAPASKDSLNMWQLGASVADIEAEMKRRNSSIVQGATINQALNQQSKKV